METVIDTDGQVLTKTTYENGMIEYRNTKGERHRIGGPAVVYPDGYQSYYVNGKRHRIDGPAVIWSDGTPEYWVDDSAYTKKQYLKIVKEYLSRNNLTDKELDKIEEISDSLFGDTLGVAQALGLFRKSLDKAEELLNDSKYEELSTLGYTKLAENFIFLQRVLGSLQNTTHEKEKLIQSIALRLGKSYEEVQPLVEEKILSCK